MRCTHMGQIRARWSYRVGTIHWNWPRSATSRDTGCLLTYARPWLRVEAIRLTGQFFDDWGLLTDDRAFACRLTSRSQFHRLESNAPNGTSLVSVSAILPKFYRRNLCIAPVN